MLKQTQLDVGICWITVTLYIKWNSAHTTWYKHIYIRCNYISYFTLVAFYLKNNKNPFIPNHHGARFFLTLMKTAKEVYEFTSWVCTMRESFIAKKVFQNRAINLSPLHINNPFWGKTKTHSNAFSVLLCVKEYNLVVLDSKLMTW